MDLLLPFINGGLMASTPNTNTREKLQHLHTLIPLWLTYKYPTLPRGARCCDTDTCGNFCCCSNWTLKGLYYHCIVYTISKRSTFARAVHHYPFEFKCAAVVVSRSPVKRRSQPSKLQSPSTDGNLIISYWADIVRFCLIVMKRKLVNT